MEKESAHADVNVSKDWPENFSLLDIEKPIQKIKESTEIDLFENAIFAKFISEIEPNNYCFHAENNEDKLVISKQPKRRVSAVERVIRLTFEEKSYILFSEIDFYKHESMKLVRESEKSISQYKAVIDEANIRATELTQRRHLFEKKFSTKSAKQALKAIHSEDVTRFIIDWIKKTEATAEKLSIQNTVLREKLKRLREHIKEKEETGETLHAVDIEQIRMRNKQLLLVIDEKNCDIQKQKLVAGQTMYELNLYKNKLSESLKEKKSVEWELWKTIDLQAKVKQEIKLLQAEVEKEASALRSLNDEIKTHRVPPVMEYVLAKREENELLKKEISYKRKMKIAAMTLKAHEKRMLKTHQKRAIEQVEA